MEEINFSNDMIESVINDPKTQDIIKENIQKAIANSIADSFRSYGSLNKAIEKKIEEVLVPYIEKYDIEKFIPKLDTVLTDIVNSTQLMDNKTILNNFKNLMIEPTEKVVTLETIFKKYCQFMADHVDTSHLDVNTDDYPSYECFECACSIEETTQSWSSYDRYDVVFESDEELEYSDDSTFGISIRKLKGSKKDEYEISLEKEITIDSLRYLSDFETYLMTLARAGVKVIDIQEFSEDVEPTAEPEASWS